MKQLALQTLLCELSGVEKGKKGRDAFICISIILLLKKPAYEEIFHVGREALKDQKQFWEDWIVLLKNKQGDIAGRLLKEAVLYSQE